MGWRPWGVLQVNWPCELFRRRPRALVYVGLGQALGTSKRATMVSDSNMRNSRVDGRRARKTGKWIRKEGGNEKNRFEKVESFCFPIGKTSQEEGGREGQVQLQPRPTMGDV